jgi:hypothetical protein
MDPLNSTLLDWPRGLRVDRVLTLVPADHAWKMSWVTRAGRGLRVEPAGRSPFATASGTGDPPPATPVVGLEAAGAWVVMGLPTQEVVARRLETPFAEAEKARQVLPSLLDAHLPFALEKCLHLFVELRRNAAGRQTALAVAARREEVERQLDTCAAVRNLRPAVVDAESLALWRQFRREHPARAGEGRVVLAYAGEEHLTLVLGEGAEWHDALAFKTTAAGAGAGEEERADLARRIQRRWRALGGDWQSGAVAWRWCGPEADLGAARAITQALSGAEAPIAVLSDGRDLLERALAAPLLLEGAPALNLLPAARAPDNLRAAASARRRRVAWSWVSAAALPTLAALAWRIDQARVEHTLRARSLDAYEAIAGAACPQPELVEVLAGRALDERRLALAPLLTGPQSAQPVAALRAALESAQAKGLTLSRVEFTEGGLHAYGPSRTPRDAEEMVAQLAGRGWSAAAESGPGESWRIRVEVSP